MYNALTRLIVSLAFLGATATVQDVWAWSVPTHKLISEKAAQASVLDKGVLRSLGFVNLDPVEPDTKKVKVGGKVIGEWIKDGAEFEDGGNIFTGRFYNHFHNPLYPAPVAGLSDIRSGQSALEWAQDPLRNADWSWQMVRQLYYEALTAQRKTERDLKFAQAFRGIGHFIHLGQEMSQPAHVRNGER